LKDDPVSLHSCLLVNKEWSRLAILVLWKYNISFLYGNPYLHNSETRSKLYNVIAHLIPNDPLTQNNITLRLNKFPRMPTPNYMQFFTRITPFWVKDMAEFLIKPGVRNYQNKLNILEKEIYNLIFSKCKKVNYFCWNHTSVDFFKCTNTGPFFSTLHSLEINWKLISDQNFSSLSEICRNISNLEISSCGNKKESLIKFIENQNNLQSLIIEFNNINGLYTSLSDAIRKKGPSLKKIFLQPTLSCVSPTFIPFLGNIAEIIFINNLNGNVDWKEWERCLKIAEFPHITRLITFSLPWNIVSLIIEKSGGKILEIGARAPLKFINYTAENKNFIGVISKYCPQLTRLTMDVEYKNLSGLCIIFSNCTQLEKIDLTIKDVLPTADELLRILSNSPPNNLRDFFIHF
jgi:hypothetical protein